MKVSYSPYELTGRRGLTNRKGALLKVQFPDGLIGYADCSPVELWGDKKLSDQLQALKNKKYTSLVKRALHFARIDAEARHQKQNLFFGLKIPKSHYLIPSLLNWEETEIDQALEEGFAFFKVKLGKKLNEELVSLKTLLCYLQEKHAKLRLDFNLALSHLQFLKLFEEIKEWQNVIDFCEDPFPFVPDTWKEIQQTNISLACDYNSLEAISHPHAANYLVYKPATQEEQPFLKSARQIVITSYLDHPLGQLAAAYVAAKMQQQMPDKINPCGLLSHHYYLSNSFSEQLHHHETQLIPPEGNGFGFDTLLQRQQWHELI